MIPRVMLALASIVGMSVPAHISNELDDERERRRQPDVPQPEIAAPSVDAERVAALREERRIRKARSFRKRYNLPEPV